MCVRTYKIYTINGCTVFHDPVRLIDRCYSLLCRHVIIIRVLFLCTRVVRYTCTGPARPGHRGTGRLPGGPGVRKRCYMAPQPLRNHSICDKLSLLSTNTLTGNISSRIYNYNWVVQGGTLKRPILKIVVKSTIRIRNRNCNGSNTLLRHTFVLVKKQRAIH